MYKIKLAFALLTLSLVSVTATAQPNNGKGEFECSKKNNCYDKYDSKVAEEPVLLNRAQLMKQLKKKSNNKCRDLDLFVYLIVSEKGKVKTVLDTSNYEKSYCDEIVLKVAKKAKFEPGKLANGKKVKIKEYLAF